jgi:general secretion pathway protein F
MPTFNYKAARSDGEIVEGSLDAHDREGVARSLQAQGSIPIQIEVAGADKPTVLRRNGQRRRGRASGATIDFFTLELATLLRAGLPLAQALETIAELAEEPALAEMTASINDAVRGGKSLSKALEKTNAGFDDFYRNMVRAGESSGALDLALERLASFRAGRRELRQSLISALIYPAILLVLALTAVAVMLAFVVPQFTEMFAEAGRDLPLLTRIVAGAGELVTDWWWLMLLMIGALGWWIHRDWQTPAGRSRWDAWLLKIPLVGTLVRNLATTRFARTLSTLLENGVHLVPAMDIARQIVGNSVIARGLALATQRVREGMGLAKPLAQSAVFPALATQLIRVGESSGKVELMLAQVAEIYEREVQNTLKRLLTLAEPIIIITIALLITVIIMSVVLMILESNNLAF